VFYTHASGTNADQPVEAFQLKHNGVLQFKRGNLIGDFGSKLQWGTQNGPYISSVMIGSDPDSQGLSFFVHPSSTYADQPIEAMRIGRNGSVGIATSDPDPTYKLSVNGSIRSKEVKVEANWSDFVFEKDYELPTLEEVEQHIAQKGHLPEIPSEEDVTENGVNLGEMDAKLLQKIEELTLYLIEQNKQLKSQNEQNQIQQSQIEELKQMNIELLKKLENK
jgi:hypothetical protein